jgi:hypothetical protein
MPGGVSQDFVVPGPAGAARVGGRGLFLPGVKAQPMTRIACLVALALLTAGCGGGGSDVTAGPTLSEEALKQKCADTQWREKNLGIWYAVCRQPANW